MLEFIRRATEAATEFRQKLDELLTEVRLVKAQNEYLSAQMELLRLADREDKRKQEVREDRERMTIIMPSTGDMQ